MGVIVTIYTVSALLREQEVPSREAWTRHHPLGWLLLGSGAGALVGTLLVFAGYDRALRRAEQRDELFEAGRAVWQLVVERLGVEMSKVAVHIWEVRGPKGFRYLGKRASFLIEHRRSSNVVWRKGKGAIGIAWEEDEPIIANVEHLRERGRNQRLFAEISNRERFGLEWREFRRSRHYSSILAIPLRSGGHVRGCMSVDIQVDGYADALDTLTQDDQFNRVLSVCEAVLAKRR